MDGTELDEIMSEALAPEVIETPSETRVAPPTDATQPRDEHGKFAPKADVTTPASADQPQAEVPDEEPESGHVPQKALHEERKKRQGAEQENTDLRRQMQEMQGQIRLLTERTMQPATPAQPKEEAKPPVFWENPDAYIEHKLSSATQQTQGQFLQTSELLAIEKHGEAAVTEAGQAMYKLAEARDPGAAAEYQRIMASRHPYGELVAWHQRHKAMQEIGSDPAAFRAQLEAEFRAKYGIVEEQPAPQPTPGNPSSTKPLTQLPKSLSRLPGGGNSPGEEDVSDSGIFAHAMAGR